MCRILNEVVRKGDILVKFERSDGLSHGAVWRKSLPGHVNSMCKGPEVETCLLCSRISRKRLHMAGTEGMIEKTVRGEFEEVTGGVYVCERQKGCVSHMSL